MPFIGAINATVRKYLASNAQVFNNRQVIVGCSGNFTSENVITNYARPRGIHSNDVSLYSCMMGRWYSGQPVNFEVVNRDFAWLEDYFTDDTFKLAALMVFTEMLKYEKQKNSHTQRMWRIHRDQFEDMVLRTNYRLGSTTIRVDSFYAGDVWDHFKKHARKTTAIFCCYAPTYSGGYEKMYSRLDEIMDWDRPTYSLMDDDYRNALLEWMSERDYIWYDDRVLPYNMVMKQKGEAYRYVYLYSNVIETPGLFTDLRYGELPKFPLVGKDFEIRNDTPIRFTQFKTTDLTTYKDAFLGRKIFHSRGHWAFALSAGDRVFGFLEFQKSDMYQEIDDLYMLADFAVPGTRYKRLSKLVVMLARSAETKKLLERLHFNRVNSFTTTAFTDRPISMKYRGVLKLKKRGESDDGKKFLNYIGTFNDLNWEEVKAEWLKKHSTK